MDSNDTKSQLVKQITTGSRDSAGSLYSQFTDNPFFTAVRWIPVLAR